MNFNALKEKIPAYAMDYISRIRTQNKSGIISDKELNDRASAYTTALCDAGVITDRERQRLYIYCTL